MSTLADMRARVRNFVRDTNADTQKLSDAELDDYLFYALADYSRHFPRQRVLEVDLPSRSVSAPPDMVPGENSVFVVEVAGALWTEWRVGAGESLPTSGERWYWRGGAITFPAAPPGPVSIWYRGLHPLPSGEEDFTLPMADEEMLVVYAAAKFHQKLGTVAAKLDRFKERGERDDNPLIMMHEVLMAQYHQIVASRKHKGSVRVRRSVN